MHFKLLRVSAATAAILSSRLAAAAAVNNNAANAGPQPIPLPEPIPLPGQNPNGNGNGPNLQAQGGSGPSPPPQGGQAAPASSAALSAPVNVVTPPAAQAPASSAVASAATTRTGLDLYIYSASQTSTPQCSGAQSDERFLIGNPDLPSPGLYPQATVYTERNASTFTPTGQQCMSLPNGGPVSCIATTPDWSAISSGDAPVDSSGKPQPLGIQVPLPAGSTTEITWPPHMDCQVVGWTSRDCTGGGVRATRKLMQQAGGQYGEMGWYGQYAWTWPLQMGSAGIGSWTLYCKPA